MLLALKIPDLIGDVVTMLSLQSAEKVARDLGGMITVSGAATDSMTIYYQAESEDVSYDIEIKDRMVHIKGITGGEGGTIMSGTTVSTGWGKIGVGQISEDLGYVNTFLIKKTRGFDNSVVKDVFDVG